MWKKIVSGKQNVIKIKWTILKVQPRGRRKGGEGERGGESHSDRQTDRNRERQREMKS